VPAEDGPADTPSAPGPGEAAGAAGAPLPPPLPGGWRAIYRDLIAGGIDEQDQLRHSQWLEPALAAAGPAEGRRALDLGCGLGADLHRLAELGWRAEGLDGEATAAAFATDRYALPVTVADLGVPLPWPDAHAHLVVSRLALHALDASAAATAAAEITRVCAPGGVLSFLVNAESHLRLRLQYDYSGAREVEPGTLYLPSLDRRYRFYTIPRARALLGPGWAVLRCEEQRLDHWGIEKRVVFCLARRLAGA
jgi:SAM-dependent methyltransferase